MILADVNNYELKYFSILKDYINLKNIELLIARGKE